MCYELYFRSRKNKEAHKVASELDKVRTPVPAAAEPQAAAQKKQPEKAERELETLPA